MQVGDVMKSTVKTTTPDQMFAHVAKLLKDNAISSVVVMDGDRLAGIVTEHLELAAAHDVTRDPAAAGAGPQRAERVLVDREHRTMPG